MIKPYIPFFSFLLLLLLVIPVSLDFATSVVPGWHTTILPPHFIWGQITFITILFATIGYWLLLKRTDKINWVLFAVHISLTIPFVIFLKFPAIFLYPNEFNQAKMLRTFEFRVKLLPVIWKCFMLAQTLFIIYFVRTIWGKKKK